MEKPYIDYKFPNLVILTTVAIIKDMAAIGLGPIVVKFENTVKNRYEHK